MNFFKKSTSILLVILLLTTIIPMGAVTVSAASYTDVVSSGKCGNYLYWELTYYGSKLTITGSGDMSNYSNGGYFSSSSIPWDDYADTITNVVLPSGITSIGNYAFYGCSKLVNINIPSNVTKIGEYAFASCKSLKTISIPNKVSAVNDYTFAWCSALTSISMGNNITKLGAASFRGCSALKSIKIPENAVVGDQAFMQCTALTSIDISSGVISIGSEAFYGCNNIESITVAEGNSKFHSENNCLIDTFGKTLVLGCKTSLIPTDESVTTIGDYSFQNCIGLTEISIPNNINEIGEKAFYGCTNLKTVNNYSRICIVKGSTSNGYAGYYADNIIWDIELSGECGENSTWELDKDTGTLIINGTGDITEDSWHNYNELIKKIVISEGITKICDNSFSGTSITEITIPNSVTYIGGYTFQNCKKLSKVIIKNSDIAISDTAFSGSSYLDCETVDVNDDIIDLRKGLYSYTVSPNKSIKMISDVFIVGYEVRDSEDNFLASKSFSYYSESGIPSVSLVSLGEGTYYIDCITQGYELRSVMVSGGGYQYRYYPSGSTTTKTIKLSIKKVSGSCGKHLTWAYVESSKTLYIRGYGDMYDYESTSLPPWSSYNSTILNIDISSMVTKIGNAAFSFSTNITNIDIPDSVRFIGDSGFTYCRRLKSVYIPENTIKIGNFAFSNCYDLNSISISKSVEEIGYFAFNYGGGLENIVVDEENSHFISVNNCLIEKDTKTLLVGANNSVIPSDGTVEIIGHNAFYGCSNLTTITIPNCVNSIGVYAFAECSNLINVTLSNNIDSISGHAFQNCKQLKSIVIPENVTSINEGAFEGCVNLKTVENYSKIHMIRGSTTNGHIAYYAEKILPFTIGDVDDNDIITDADAVYLLMYTFFPEDYEVNQSVDYNGDGAVNDADAVYLLMYTFFPEDYPIV